MFTATLTSGTLMVLAWLTWKLAEAVIEWRVYRSVYGKR